MPSIKISKMSASNDIRTQKDSFCGNWSSNLSIISIQTMTKLTYLVLLLQIGIHLFIR